MDIAQLVKWFIGLNIALAVAEVAIHGLLMRSMRRAVKAWVRNFEHLDFRDVSSLSDAKLNALFRLDAKHSKANALVTEAIIDREHVQRNLQRDTVNRVLVSTGTGIALAYVTASLTMPWQLGTLAILAWSIAIALKALHKSFDGNAKLQTFEDKLDLQYQVWTCPIDEED